MKGKTKTILTVLIAILVFAIAIVGTVTFLKDDGEASATEEGVGNVLPVTGADGEQNPPEGLNGNENPADQPTEDNNENPTAGTNGGTTGGNAQGTTTGNRNPGSSTNAGQTEPEPTTIEQERLVSTTLNWSNISLNSTIGRTGINYTTLAYRIEYYQVIKGEDSLEYALLNKENGMADYKTTVEVTDEQIKENCPKGYKLDETSELSLVITENVEENVIKVYYIKDRFDLTIEYEYEDGTEAEKPYEKDYEYGEDYSVESPEIPGYTPDKEVVEGTMPGEDTTIKVIYTPDEDTKYTVEHYLEKSDGTFELKDTETLEGTTDTTVTATSNEYEGFTFNKNVKGTKLTGVIAGDGSLVLKLYYTRNSYNLKIEYEYEDGTEAEKPYEKNYEYGEDYSVESPEIPGYTPDKEVVEGTMPGEDTTIKVIYTPDEDTKYTVEHYLENLDGTFELKDTENLTGTTDITVTAEPNTYEGFTFNKNVEGTKLTGVIAGDGSLVLKLYYTRNNYNYTVKYWYEATSDGEFIELPDSPAETKSAVYGTTITNNDIKGFDEKTFKGKYVYDHVTPVDNNDQVSLTITDDPKNNVINVYYIRNSFNYKVEYYKDSVNGTKLGTSETHQQKVGTVMTEEVVASDLGDGWINDKKPQVGYQKGNVVGEPITIQANNENVIKVVYKPIEGIDYTIKYYYNEVEDPNKVEYGTGYYGQQITAPGKDNNGEWTLLNESLVFTIASTTENIFEVRYAKPDISIKKTSTPSVTRENGTVEYGETIKYTITATNKGLIAGTVKIADVIPEGTTLVEGTITATGYENVTVDMLNAGIDLNVAANNGTAKVEFTVTVVANAGSNVENTPIVNGTEDKTNTVIDKVEKTIQVKPKTQSVQNSNVVIVLDTSKSMEQTASGTNEDRIVVAKRVVNNFIDKLNLPETTTEDSCSVAVVSFNNSATIVGYAYNSSEATTLKNNVTGLNCSRGTNMTDGLEKAKTALQVLIGNKPNNKNIVIFVGDGEPGANTNVNTIPTKATELKGIGNCTVYAVGFDTDVEILKDQIATSENHYYKTSETSGLADIFTSIEDDLANFESEQSTEGLVELEGIYADATHPIVITVDGSALGNITILPTDTSGYVVLIGGKYYLDLTKFEANTRITIEYYSNN